MLCCAVLCHADLCCLVLRCGILLCLCSYNTDYVVGSNTGPSADDCQHQIAKLQREMTEPSQGQQTAAASGTHAKQQLATLQARLDR